MTPKSETLRRSAARQSRDQNGPRLWSQTQPQRAGIAPVLRLVKRTQPRSEKSSRLSTILSDADKMKLCATVGRKPGCSLWERGDGIRLPDPTLARTVSGIVKLCETQGGGFGVSGGS
jgi:hypothetical protein